MKKCSQCGAENPDNAKFCHNCGSKDFSIKSDGNICPKCGKTNVKDAKFCHSCGASLNSNSSSSSSTIKNDFSSSDKKSASSFADKNISGSAKSNSSSNKNSSSDSTNKTNSNSNKVNSSSVSSDSKTNETGKKDHSVWKFCCCYVPVILFVFVLIIAMLMQAFPENFDTSYDYEFQQLDMDGDGRLSFLEARQLDPTMSDAEIEPYFNQADKNNNGYIIGYEFDSFLSDVKPYSSSSSDDYSSSSSSSSNSHKYSSSSSSSSSSSDYDDYDYSSDGYVLTCPYCGSEAIYESGNYYQCADCGNTIYNPDDLELNYQEGYMDLLVPITTVNSLGGI